MAKADSDSYRRNLTALAAFQPTVAAVVDSIEIPSAIVSATGRDGSRTFLLPTAEGRRRWFGGSSMPTISATETLSGFLSDGRNVVLPGILTGLEPLLVARRLAPHTAIFVAEPSPLHAKLALHLYDYSELLRAGRLVFALGDNERLVESLCGFFRRHPGYELPIHLIHVPQVSANRMAEIQDRLEAAGAAVTDFQAKRIEEAARELRAGSRATNPDAPRVAVLGVDPHPAALDQARRIRHALAKLGWAHAVCIPDKPYRCHLLARLETVAGLKADLALFVGAGAADMGPFLPDDLPVTSWYLPGTSVHSPRGQSDVHDTVSFVASESIYRELLNAGGSGERIERCPVAADDTVFRPLATPPESVGSSGVDVVVLADLPDDRPEACGVTLTSHRALWRSLQIAARHRADRYRSSIAAELLDAAQRDSGTALQDADVRRHFETLVRTRIAPVAIAQTAVQALVKRGCRVGAWGMHWDSIELAGLVRGGAIPTGEALNDIFHRAQVVLLTDSSARFIQAALDALATGTPVIVRTPESPFEKQYPGLQGLAPHLHFYRTVVELEACVSRLVRRDVVEPHAGDPSERDPTSTARKLVLAEHTVAHRLVMIWEAVRSRSVCTALPN